MLFDYVYLRNTIAVWVFCRLHASRFRYCDITGIIRTHHYVRQEIRNIDILSNGCVWQAKP